MKLPVRLLQVIVPCLFVFCLPLFSSSIASADGNRKEEKGIGLSISLAPIYQFDADVGGSEFGVTRFLINIDKNLIKSSKSILSLGISYGIADYSFSGPPSDIWSDPWGTVHSAAVGANHLLLTGSKWGALFGGSLDWTWEEGADAGDGLTYGGFASASYSAHIDRRIGLGVGVFSGLEITRAYPFIAVSWRFTDRLSLENPLRVGPAGPAGLELRYDINEQWQVGGGAAYRSFRFRLDDGGIAPEGIGNVEGLPVWLRVSHRLRKMFTFNIYGGMVFDGQLRLEDEGGSLLDEESYDSTFITAITIDVEL